MNYFIPPSLYFKLLVAYFRNGVKIKSSYKHLDLIHENELLETEIVDFDLEKVGNLDFMMPTYSDTYTITTKGKTLLFRINWGIFFAVVAASTAVIGWIVA
ncbi:hypothetical protein [Staphylococcus cohnii]|uniref:hypothetical protein n=1 Tax=Staphylococcus cohnii TaxID=29382 RepID=UPI0011063F39|nr:hypothetical protein [Staphylococcus cohnii]TLW35966.1 hypothetical protein FFX88_08695 [Staphylococcus cohnii]